MKAFFWVAGLAGLLLSGCVATTGGGGFNPGGMGGFTGNTAPIHISDAYYNAPNGNRCDARGAIKDACQGRQSCTIAANNALCGDPQPGARKTLTIGFKCGGNRIQRDIVEGSTTELRCATSGASSAAVYNAGRMHISDAYWTAEDGRRCEATAEVRSGCEGKESCQVAGNNGLCGDPAPGVRKTLVIGYKCGGGREEFYVPEGRTSRLGC